jgi:hypothetical protein
MDGSKMRKIYIIATMLIASPALADNASPYEDAAKIDIRNLASMILAARICPNVQFSSDQVIPHLVGAALILKGKGVQEAYLSATKAAINQITTDREAWCAGTLKAAKDRHSEMLTEVAP